jgi:hypothetical protein
MGMVETAIVGIDCATRDAKIGLALAQATPDHCIINSAAVCGRTETASQRIAGWLNSAPRALLAIDAPLGWPEPMGRLLATHMAGTPIKTTAHDLFRRETDRFVKDHFRKQSLDVGADRIARTAHAALCLIDDIRRITGHAIPLAWTPAFPDRVTAIEVYPAATLRAHGLPSSGYKKVKDQEERQSILAGLRSLVSFPDDTAGMEQNALVAARSLGS